MVANAAAVAVSSSYAGGLRGGADTNSTPTWAVWAWAICSIPRAVLASFMLKMGHTHRSNNAITEPKLCVIILFTLQIVCFCCFFCLPGTQMMGTQMMNTQATKTNTKMITKQWFTLLVALLRDCCWNCSWVCVEIAVGIVVGLC